MVSWDPSIKTRDTYPIGTKFVKKMGSASRRHKPGRPQSTQQDKPKKGGKK